MTFANCFTAFLIALFVLVVFVILPPVKRNRYDGDFGVTSPDLVSFDQLTDAQKLEDVC